MPKKVTNTNKERLRVNYDGVIYPSALAFCKAHSLNYSRFLRFSYAHRNVDQSIWISKFIESESSSKDSNFKQGVPRSVEYQGVVYPSVWKFCKHRGWDYSSFKTYRRRYAEDDWGTFINRYEKFLASKVSVEYRGVRYESLAALARDLGIEPNRFNAFMYKQDNLTLEEAVDKYRKVSGKVKRKPLVPVEVKGVSYRSARAAAQALGVPYKEWREALRKQPGLRFEDWAFRFLEDVETQK